MPWYRKLPPISRTPTPPPDVLRRLRPFSCNPFEPVEVDGQDRDDGDDEDGNTVPTNSNGHSFPLVKGIREPKKHYLPVGKDSTGRSKRQRLGKHPQTEEVSPDIVLENESVSEWDTLGSIFVAGGFLMMGNWFGNRDDGGKDEKDEVGERDNENLAETRTEQVTNDTRSVVSGSGREGNFNSMGGECVDRLQSNEQTTTKRPQRPNVRHSYNTNPIVKGRLRTATPLKHDEFSEVLDVDNCNIGEPIFRRSDNHNDDTGPNDPNRTVSTSKTIEDSRGFADTRKTPQLTDPLSPDNKGKSVEKVINSTIPEDTINKQAVSPTSMVESVIPCTALDTNKPRELPSEDTELRKKAEGDEWLKGLTFEILALPERIATSVRGRDFFDSGSHKLCWDELKEKINQGLGIGPNLPHSTVIVNWKFRLKNQADLDICIERLIPHGRPIHHIVVLFCSTDTNASATPGAKIDEESVTKEVVKILEAQDRNYWMGKNVTSSVADLIAGSNADVWSKLPGEARDSIRQNSSNPQQALPHSPAPLPENPTTLNPTWTSISHIPIAPKPPHWGTPNFPSTSPSKKIQTTANNTQLYYSSTARKVTTEQLLAQLMAPGNKSGNKTDESSAPPSTDGASTPAAAKWKSKPPPRNPSARTRNAVPSEIFQVHRNTRSSSRAAKLSLLDQPQKEAEASKASDQPSSSTASADTHKSLPKRRGSPRGQSRAKKRLAKSTDPASNLQESTFHNQQSGFKVFSATMRQPPKDQTSLAPSKALATVRGLAKSDPAETNSVSDAMDMDPSSPTTNGAKDSGQGTEPSDLSTNEGSVLDKANAGNTVYTMDEKTKHEADILFKAVMEGYNSAEKQPNPSMKHSTPSASKPEEGDVASRGTEPAAIAAPLPISAGGKGDTGARGSKSPIAKPKSVQATARPLTNSSPALVIGELGAEIRPAKGTEPVAATKSQPTTLKGSEGDSIIIENKSPVAKPKPKGIATPLTPATDSHAMGRLHDTSDQASDRTSDQCSNRLEPKPVWPVPPPPPHSVFPPATKTLPTPRPPAYRKPDSSPGPKSAESAKATINDNPQAPEEAVSTATPNSNGGSFSKKLVPKPTGPLVASSDALAAARKLAVQEKGLKSKAKNVPRNVLPTPMLPPRYQDTRAQSPQSQSLETNSARPSPQPLTPITSAQISVHKPASYAKPSPSSDTKTTGTTGIAKSSVHREGVLFPHTVPGLSNTPSPTSSVPTPPPMSMATTPSKNVDDSRSIPEKTKDATANPIASRPFYKAPKSAIEEPSPQFTPLVSKSNFLYFEPSAVKKSPGDPHEKQPATPNLAPLSDLPSTSSPGTKPKPGRMVFTVTRYKDDNNATTTITPFHSAKFYGHEILSAGESNRFSWEKLCEILESRHKFVDFKECLVINRFHVVEGEKDLNEGLNLGIYLNVNEVLIVKVDLLGRLPPPLVAEMKAARLAARKAGKEVE